MAAQKAGLGGVPAKGHLLVVEGRATLVGACGMRRDSLL